MWALNGLVLAAAVALYAGPVHGLAPLARPNLPWPLIAILFGAAELCVVHLHFRRGALSFSLGEIPLVFGLVFCGASGVLVACLLGSAVILRWFRKLPPIKLVFNLATFALATGIGLLVVHAIAAACHRGNLLSGASD